MGTWNTRSGKSILSSLIITTLLSKQSNGESILVIYFFFDTRNAEKQTLNDLLRSLISQLYSAIEPARGIPNTLFLNKYENGNKQLSLKDLETIFLSMVRATGQAVKIILDALDESSTQQEVFNWIQSSRTELEISASWLLVVMRR